MNQQIIKICKDLHCSRTCKVNNITNSISNRSAKTTSTYKGPNSDWKKVPLIYKDNLPWIEIHFSNHITSKALIDTGAAITLMSVNFFQHLNNTLTTDQVNISETNISAQSCSGNPLKLEHQVEIECSFNKLDQLSLTFLTTADMFCDIILGWNCLQNIGTLLDINQGY